MIQNYLIVAGRIRQEVSNLETTVNRAERAIAAARREVSENRDLFVDAAALSLHDFYTGLERILSLVATNVDKSMPSTQNWHRDLLSQMGITVSGLRPPVLSMETINLLDEYRRFRHVVRNIYAFDLDPEKLMPLMDRLEECFRRSQTELLAFADRLEQLGSD
ncbi:MAG: hypothetical protein SXA11_26175 [Cyanobacteriota bacterium]|nr:hypothetical protein [Cyanobacteriota bacterium]